MKKKRKVSSWRKLEALETIKPFAREQNFFFFPMGVSLFNKVDFLFDSK